ncbi:MAG TPA: MATE family efflux transporter [Clostridiales bacterium]|mgnify:FL=1|nr:MATE family efflux transporter [Clostridiales bacterium]
MAAGNPAQNRFGAANKLNNFLMCPMNALSTAIVSFNAQNLGAGRQDRIRRGTGKSLLIGLAMHLVLGGAGMLLTINGAYQYLFMSADKITAATIRCGNLYLYVDLSMYFALMILLVFRLGVQGVGHAEFALAAGCAELVARYLLGGAHKKPSGND